MKKVKTIKITEDLTKNSRCDEGFLRLNRFLIQNVYEDGSESKPYHCDVMNRSSVDAVAVVIYFQKNMSTYVVLRRCLRPPVFFRKNLNVLKNKSDPELFVLEIVAGLLEDDDINEKGINKRASIEVYEETGYKVKSENVIKLGKNGVFSTPGTSSEKVYLRAVQIEADMKREDITGDGSSMEEGSTLFYVELDKALEMCDSGKITDGKTEIGLNRLKKYLENKKL